MNEQSKLDEILALMVNNFLGWRLPNDFSPDAGIKFTEPKHLYPDVSNPDHLWPSGTNLFTANQTKEMMEAVVTPVITALVEAEVQRRIAEMGEESVGWICNDRLYRVQQRDDAGFGELYPGQYEVYATPPQAQLQAAIDKAREEAAEYLMVRCRYCNQSSTDSIRQAGGQMTKYAEAMTREAEIAARYAKDIRALIGKPLGGDSNDAV